MSDRLLYPVSIDPTRYPVQQRVVSVTTIVGHVDQDPVTLAAGSDTALTIAGQQLTLANIYLATEVNDLLPWVVDINTFATAASHTNWNSISATPDSYAGALESSGAQNDEITWPVVLAAGTWTFSLVHVTDANRGIYSIQFDGVEKGTIDGYSAGNTKNVVSAVASIAVATTAKLTLKLKMATKNGSSSSYYGAIQHVRLLRTA